MIDPEDDLNPEEALKKLRAAGIREEKWVKDVRAGRCQITSLTATSVILVPESGQPLDAGDATDLWDAYQNGSICPLDEDP